MIGYIENIKMMLYDAIIIRWSNCTERNGCNVIHEYTITKASDDSYMTAYFKEMSKMKPCKYGYGSIIIRLIKDDRKKLMLIVASKCQDVVSLLSC